MGCSTITTTRRVIATRAHRIHLSVIAFDASTFGLFWLPNGAHFERFDVPLFSHIRLEQGNPLQNTPATATDSVQDTARTMPLTLNMSCEGPWRSSWIRACHTHYYNNDYMLRIHYYNIIIYIYCFGGSTFSSRFKAHSYNNYIFMCSTPLPNILQNYKYIYSTHTYI